ncbi:hypothetical protein EON63_20890 [archaeon]|nr:MAG: hypothetical protein EON63_20890 [archaeon]
MCLRLSNKSLSQEAAQRLADYILTYREQLVGGGLSRLELGDIIASRPEEEALQVLDTICSALASIATTGNSPNSDNSASTDSATPTSSTPCASASIEYLDLSDNALGAKGIRACSPLLSLPSLKVLLLCNNGLSAEAMDLLGDYITATPLSSLYLYNNMSGDEGARAVSKVVRGLAHSLREFRYSATRAGQEGSLELATVSTIWVWEYGYEYVYCYRYVSLFMYGHVFVWVYITTITIPKPIPIPISIMQALGEVNNLVWLDVSDNSFGAAGSSALGKTLKMHVWIVYACRMNAMYKAYEFTLYTANITTFLHHTPYTMHHIPYTIHILYTHQASTLRYLNLRDDNLNLKSLLREIQGGAFEALEHLDLSGMLYGVRCMVYSMLYG